MNEKEVKRKLAAILSADVKGYSRLMEEDEVATVRTMEEYRGVISEFIEKHRGRVVDSPGDNLLAEFGSVVDAVECAVEIQKELRVRNADIPEKRRMEFRIGVNLGDVIDESGRLYGDGINVAARIEGLAEPSGICISRTAFDQIKKKLNLGYKFLGEHSVKNISEPVRVYQVLMDPEAAGKVIGEKRFLGKISRRAAIAAAIVFVIVAGGLISWNIYLHQSKKVEAASLDKMTYPLPDKPSIAVLPFDNLSGDPEQEYLADGITENIIMALSKMPEMFVIALDSTFTYKGKPIKAKQVSEELGVRYVLEGSVQRSGDQLRITVQLIDAVEGYHLWSERYDRELKDIFALQDEITVKIISALDVKLVTGGEVAAQDARRGTKSLQAYLKFMEASHYVSRGTPEDYALARKLSEEAIALDPEYSHPHLILAWTYIIESRVRSKSPRQSLEKAFKLGQKAVAIDESDAWGHRILGFVYSFKREHEKAIAELERGIALDPNDAKSYMILAQCLIYAGRAQEAIPLLKKSMRLSPLSQTHASQCLWRLGMAYRTIGQYEEALSALKKAVEIRPKFFAIHLDIAATYIHLGREEEARGAAAEVRRIMPKYSLERSEKRSPIKNPAEKERYYDALRKAGL